MLGIYRDGQLGVLKFCQPRRDDITFEPWTIECCAREMTILPVTTKTVY